MPTPKKLGTNLEWHGNRIRMAMLVPPSMVARAGELKLKESLNTPDVFEDERKKVDVIKRLRSSLHYCRRAH